MKDVPIRLGPMALLLCVISICLTTLSMLSFANASADQRLAQRYGQTVQIRYSLEQKGQEFLRDSENGMTAETEKMIEEDGYRLHIRLEDGKVAYWKISRIWEEPDATDHLWEG